MSSEPGPQGSDLSLRFELFTDDIAALRDFFVRALRFEADGPGSSYVEVRSGDVRIGIGVASDLTTTHPLRPQAGERLGLGVEIVLETDDVEDCYEHARSSGATIESPLRLRSWGSRDFRLVAPGGYYIRVTSRTS